jgi:hypothetical protein
MRKVFTYLIFTFLSITAFSQYYMDWGFKMGVSNYLGDIGGKEKTRRDFVLDMRLQHTRWNFGGFFRYKLSSQIATKVNLEYIRIEAYDANSTNPGRRARNLDFRNDMFELTNTWELYIYKVNDVGRTGRYRTDFQLYIFAGFGGLYHNPKGQLNGAWYALQPLKTEGQDKPYSKLQFVIPSGLGFYYSLNRKYRIGMEIGWRTTFTDYLDDISTTYADPASLDSDLARALANKTTPQLLAQINNENNLDPGVLMSNFQTGSKRGDSKHNDSYLTADVTFSFMIRGKSSFYRAKHSFVLGRKKRRSRRSRAKF